MDIKQLYYFLTIVEEGSISKAAKKLHMAQPPLSQQLKLLEEELNVKLIERSTRKLKVTDVGIILSKRAKQIVNLMGNTEKEVKDISEGLAGTLTIGTVSSAGASILPIHIKRFLNKYPNIHFEILDEDSNRIIELLHNSIIDIGIICTPFNNDELESIIMPDEPMIVVGTNLPWNNNKKYITFSDLCKVNLMVQQRFEKKIIELSQKSGFNANIFCKSNDVRTLLLWASNGIGLAIVPKNCINLVQSEKLKFIEVKEPALTVGTAIIWRKNQYLSSIAKHFLETFITN